MKKNNPGKKIIYLMFLSLLFVFVTASQLIAACYGMYSSPTGGDVMIEVALTKATS